MYRSTQFGGLGQGLAAGSTLVPGVQYTIQLAISTSGILGVVLPSAPSESSLNVAVGELPMFQGGMLGLLDATISDSTATLTIIAGPGSDVLTLGGVAAAIADQLNTVASGYSFSVMALGGGLGTTTAVQQFQQAGGITLSPVAPIAPGTPNPIVAAVENIPTEISGALPSLGGISWGWIAAAAGAVLLILALK